MYTNDRRVRAGPALYFDFRRRPAANGQEYAVDGEITFYSHYFHVPARSPWNPAFVLVVLVVVVVVQ